MNIKIELQNLTLLHELPELLIIPIVPQEQTRTDIRAASALQQITKQTREFLESLDSELGGWISKRLKSIHFRPAINTSYDLICPRLNKPLQLRLTGISQDVIALTGDGLECWRKLGGEVLNTARQGSYSEVAISLYPITSKTHFEKVLQAVSEGIYLSAYKFNRYKSKLIRDTLSGIVFKFLTKQRYSNQQRVIQQQAKIVSDAVCFARDLVNTSPNDMLPSDLVKAAKKIKGQCRGSKLTILDEKKLAKLKAGLILSVAGGSKSKPFLIHLTKSAKIARGKTKPTRIVLLGKGVTFDSGGLSIKPSKGMEDMKCDMAGAAAVLSIFKGFSDLGLSNIELHALIPTTENSVSATSTRPGDIVRSLSGKTVEILNTDAEGRLILADALTYAERIKAEIIVDLATLTGACVVALGEEYAGVFSEDVELRDSLLRAASASGEPMWPLPLAKQYKDQLKSQIADLKNIGSGSGGGATIGALFLEEFVPKNTRWAHIDIAGPAFSSKSKPYSPAGGSGYGVRTLLAWLRALSVEKKGRM